MIIFFARIAGNAPNTAVRLLLLIVGYVVLTGGCCVLPKAGSTASPTELLEQIAQIEETVAGRLEHVLDHEVSKIERHKIERECGEQILLSMRVCETGEKWAMEEGKIIYHAWFIEIHNQLESIWGRISMGCTNGDLVEQLLTSAKTIRTTLREIQRGLGPQPRVELGTWLLMPKEKRRT